jgi:predicted nucleic acid-binding protein
MNVYADTSVLIALFHPADVFSEQVNDWVGDQSIDLIWNSLLRNEVRHNLRKLNSNYSRTAWNSLRAAENTGRLAIGRERLNQLLDAADELSVEHAKTTSAGTWDYFHVAAAMAASAECFATCDQLQAELAKAAGGFSQVKSFKV